jgi:threonyl-tRNA synthetase
LPWRIADFCPLHRNELRGVLGGMTRVRKFSQDDAHIYCTEDQIQQEIKELLDFVKFIYHDTFKMEYVANLSTKPDEALGSAETWQKAEAALAKALESVGIKYVVKPKDGAFYGPKIDFEVKDAIGRMWQLATIQLDFQMPQRFKLQYTAADNTMKTPVMIHRAILGSLERFMAVLIEHYAGKFPVWLSPIQARILPLSDKFNGYAGEIGLHLKQHNIRVDVDTSNETLNKKVRQAQLDQIPYILVVGEKEMVAKSVAVRTRDGKVHGEVKTNQFIESLLREIAEKK